MDRTIEAILTELNIAIKTVSFGSQITAYNLCDQQTTEKGTFPLLNLGNGEGKQIHWDDTEPLRCYHRMTEQIEHETDPDKGIGARSSKITTYKLRAVFIGTRKALTSSLFEDNESFSREVADVFPTMLSNQEFIQVGEIQADKNTLYAEEFDGVSFSHLSLDGIAFAINYELKVKDCSTLAPITVAVNTTERSLTAILDEINVNVKQASFGKHITSYGFCYQQTNENGTFPLLNIGNGEGKIIHWNDNEALRI